ncbi:MAG: hypothetical protein FD165_2904, partial [Gammaproteobacteria bacterium]
MTQSAGIITASRLGVRTQNAVNLTAANNVNILTGNVSGAGNAFTFQNEADGFAVGGIAANGTIFSATAGITTAATTASGAESGDITLSATAGSITISQNLTTGNATVANAAGVTTAKSGDISVTSVTGITGAGRLITGNASVDAVTAGNIDTATSGTITLNVTGSGDVGLSVADALTIGSATVTNNTADDTATTGNIVITSADRVNNGTPGSALDVSFGSASGGQTNTAGTLATTTDGGAAAAGEIRFTSGEALTLGALTTAGGT